MDDITAGEDDAIRAQQLERAGASRIARGVGRGRRRGTTETGAASAEADVGAGAGARRIVPHRTGEQGHGGAAHAGHAHARDVRPPRDRRHPGFERVGLRQALPPGHQHLLRPSTLPLLLQRAARRLHLLRGARPTLPPARPSPTRATGRRPSTSSGRRLSSINRKTCVDHEGPAGTRR